MTVLGGLRARLLFDSFVAVTVESLTTLGWLDPGRAHQPITVSTIAPPWDQPVAINTVTISAHDTTLTYQELGSDLGTDTISMTVAFYAESDSLGVHVTNDIRDALRGRLPMGAIGGRFPILDFRLPTPAPLGYAQISGVRTDRRLAISQEQWATHLHAVDCWVEDTYYPGTD